MSVRRARALGLSARQLGSSALEAGDEEADLILASGAAAHVDEMLTYTAAGTADDVRAYLDRFVELTEADELITVHPARSPADRLRSISRLAEAVGMSSERTRALIGEIAGAGFEPATSGL